MATGMAHSIDAPKTMGRGMSQKWLLPTDRSLFRCIGGGPAPQACVELDGDCEIRSSCMVAPGLRSPNVASGSPGNFDFYTSLRRDSTVEVSKRGALPGEVDR